tara:strand:+ start:1419 stop:1796 length:378 start_codon:yes stop_codon:yes gene_type:complete
MNINIGIDRDDIRIVVKKYIVDLARKIKKDDRYTKFDSENDVFLGVLGEIAFKKRLREKGFIDGRDFEHISELKQNGEYVKKIDEFSYDLFDFKLDFLFDENGNNISGFNIDVKTQKYVGKYNNN